jgi:hypothetical protein
MMTCKDIVELLMPYCDGELTKEYCDLICHHLRLCGACHNFMESYQITIKITNQLPPACMSRDFMERLLKAMINEECGQQKPEH